MNKPELLAPAGDLEKLKIAVLYGADAVYIGGEAYGLRAKAKNFDLDTMAEGIQFAHDHGAKVYITANIFAHNADFEGMAEYFKAVEKIGADALIISDLGVFSVAKEAVPNMEIHVSTQANNTNYMSAGMWYKLGAKRVVIARELSFGEVKQIRENIPEDMDIEAFVHGAMCISYSGRCLLSNYLSGRDANKGACSHPCRWKYHLVEETRPGEYMPIEENERGTYIYNSKDLCMIEHIPDILESGIMSLKIEGRMKTPFYVGTVVKAYRQAIDDYMTSPDLYREKLPQYLEEVSKASHRDYTEGFYYEKPNGNQQIYNSNTYIRGFDFVGMVQENSNPETGIAIVEQRNKFSVGDTIEVMPAKGNAFTMKVSKMWDADGNPVESAPHPQQILQILFDRPVKKYDMLRKNVLDAK
ncbi:MULTISPECIES: peptidase U32 family protein [Anaerotignum]|uniref:peptidase U32 family protein n=1 Tax=Anaerotignum TaxID=2039240 RepID=UPI00210A9A1F|nr:MULTISPECIES: U32 family peptidase [Anaerotignum]MCQ4935809.1 U32 family peptidase [Anaerotignum propionicum]